MATNIIRDDDRTLVIEAVGAAYDSGDFIVDGMLHGISINDVANGADAVVQCKGEATYTKKAGEAWAEGQELYFDSGNDRFTTTMTADGIVRAKAAKAALLAATSGEIEIIEGHYASEASLIVYDNSTSGLAANRVAAALDEIDATVDGLGTHKMELVGTPTAGNLIKMDATGQGVDSGVAAANVQVLTVPAFADNLAGLTALGALKDSLIPASAVTGVYNIVTDRIRNSTNTAQSLNNSTATDIALEDSEVTGDVTVDVTNKQFTIPTTGVYALTYSATFATSGGGTKRIASILVNGASTFSVEKTPSGVSDDVCSDYAIAYLAATDVVKLSGWQDSGGALNVTGGRLAIQRIQ